MTSLGTFREAVRLRRELGKRAFRKLAAENWPPSAADRRLVIRMRAR